MPTEEVKGTNEATLSLIPTSIDDCNEDEARDLIVTLPIKIQRFVHLYVTGQYTISKLAQLLELHPNTLNYWLRKPIVKNIIHEMQQTTHDIVTIQLKALTQKAVDKLGKLADSPIDGVALQAVKDILDRAGHKSKQEIKIDKTVRTFEEKLSNLIENVVELDFEMIDDD